MEGFRFIRRARAQDNGSALIDETTWALGGRDIMKTKILSKMLWAAAVLGALAVMLLTSP